MAIFNKEFISTFLENDVEDDAKAIKSEAIRFYKHMLKWRYQETARSKTWVESIIGARREIKKHLYNNKKDQNKKDTNVENSVNPELSAKYQNAISEAIAETGVMEINNDSQNTDPLFNRFHSVETIININSIVDYMMRHKGTLNPGSIDFIRKNSTIQSEYNGYYYDELFG